MTSSVVDNPKALQLKFKKVKESRQFSEMQNDLENLKIVRTSDDSKGKSVDGSCDETVARNSKEKFESSSHRFENNKIKPKAESAAIDEQQQNTNIVSKVINYFSCNFSAFYSWGTYERSF